MAIGKKIRFEVFKRDSFTCQYCGRSAPDVTLQVDHIKPRKEGGSDDILNLVTSCWECNIGKGGRKLDDQTTVKKRKKQLDEIQERREQLTMLIDWQRGLMLIDDDIITQLDDLWSDLTGYYWTDEGKKDVRMWIKKFKLTEIIAAMQTSVTQYAIYDRENPGSFTKESIQKVFRYIPLIAQGQKKYADKPHMKGLFYARGILRNRLNYVNEYEAIQMMVDAHERGATIEQIQGLTKTVQNWTSFKEEIAILGGNNVD